MMNFRLFCSAAALLITGCGEAPQKGEMSADEVTKELSRVEIRPGKWQASNEIISVSAPGMPAEILNQMKGQKTNVESCITPEQAAKPDATFFAAQENSNCTFRDWSMGGGRMKGSITCEGGQMPGKVVMTMEGEYGAERYDLVTNMETSGLPNGMSMNMKARTIGQRVGNCA